MATIELPSTTDRPAIQPVGQSGLFGVRLWLALMFAAIGTLGGASVYIFVSESSERAADDTALEIILGRALSVREGIVSELTPGPLTARDIPERVLAESQSESFRTWVVAANRRRITTKSVFGVDFDTIRGRGPAIRAALNGEIYRETYRETGLAEDRTIVALPLVNAVGIRRGALLALAERPGEVTSALQALRGERLTALAVGVLVAAIIGFLAASLITSRVKRLATAAREIAAGHLDVRVEPGGRDEIGDLGRAFDSMRLALAETFDALSSERDRLSAVLSSLDEAVIVVGADGEVRFANPAASGLIEDDGRPAAALRPWLNRATHRGFSYNDHVPHLDRVLAISARNLPAEGAALIVVRDRTEELRRDEAEREFVSNAAHELRNPIAGMSGVIEVLRSGAKDDPVARDRFLDRLADDVDRVSRLTKALLTLARMEATGEGEAEVVGVELAVNEAIDTVEVPDGVELRREVDGELTASADPVLLRQVLIGLLTNAFKHTPAPGIVTLRAHADGEGRVLIEVQDSGTGIAPEERDRVFERFYRGSGSLEREGFGLGLAIAKRMVEVMGGEISVASTEGQGSTFRVGLVRETPTGTPIA